MGRSASRAVRDDKGKGNLLMSGCWQSLSLHRASLVTQLIKGLPAMQETWVRSLAWEDPLEKGMATHSSILA